jgi:hypothetical protein
MAELDRLECVWRIEMSHTFLRAPRHRAAVFTISNVTIELHKDQWVGTSWTETDHVERGQLGYCVVTEITNSMYLESCLSECVKCVIRIPFDPSVPSKFV